MEVFRSLKSSNVQPSDKNAKPLGVLQLVKENI